MPFVTNYNCCNCGAPLPNLKTAVGTCQFCDSPYIIETMQTYQETVLSEEIKSGVSFTASPEIIHKTILDFLTHNNAAPIDILTATTVEEIVPLVIPAYYFHYNGTSDYMCDIGIDNEKFLSANSSEIKKVTETTWSTISGNVRSDVQGIISAHPEYDEIVNTMFYPYQSSFLTDIESLKIPFDAVTLKFTRPSSSLLDEFIRPQVIDELKTSVLRQIGGRKSRNLTLGSTNIQSDKDIEKLLVGVYKIILKHKNISYTLFVSADGEKMVNFSDYPLDRERDTNIKALQKELDSLSNGSTALIIISVILGICLSRTIVVPIVAVLIIILNIKHKKEYGLKFEELSRKLENEKNIISRAKARFIEQNTEIGGFDKIHK